MITVTRLNQRVAVVNAELIKMIEAAPDTIITFVNGDSITVREPVEEIVRKAIDYQRQIHGFRMA